MGRMGRVRSQAGASVSLHYSVHTGPIIQWVLSAVSPGAKRSGLKDDRSPASGVEVKNGGAIPSLFPRSTWRTNSPFNTAVM
jgi:hypothetical protein